MMWQDIIKSDEIIELIRKTRQEVAKAINKTQIQEYKDIYVELMNELGEVLKTAENIENKKRDAMDTLDRDDRRLGEFW